MMEVPPVLTREMFLAFYPQFVGFEPEMVMEAYLEEANARFGDFGVDTAKARRLYVAHYLTMYARMAVPEGGKGGMKEIAWAGEREQKIASKKVGEVAVTYAAGSSSSGAGSATFRELAETDFGLQLLDLIRMYSLPKYVR